MSNEKKAQTINNRKYEDWQARTRPNSTQWDPTEADTQPYTTQPEFPPHTEDNTIERLQPIRISNTRAPIQKSQSPKAPRKRSRGCGCCFWIILIPVLLVLVAALIFPGRTNILILGIDRAPEGTDIGRSDTNIILGINPPQAQVNMLSIPRDLWVNIPNVGENRINTAHFFAEGVQKGSGPYAAMDTVRQNFGVTIDYFARIRFNGLKEIVNAMGGITLTLDEPMSGYEAGQITLDGDQALAFARDRSGSDDFFRMQRGQMVITAAVKKLLNPLTWLRLPIIVPTVFRAVDTNVPIWEMPRVGVALIRAVLTDNLNTKTITREMVIPYTTDQGANILLPIWEAINPLLFEMFGE
ncbi:MAG: hypothetical protein BGO78_08625 [Chloroflexi bacterium 44-23]|nr:MAG: hypothetical protein BGO78_08625 [Chloroflexi bacterium 44-23]